METMTPKRPSQRDWRSRVSTRQGTGAIAIFTALVAAAILIVALQKYRQGVDANSRSQTVLVASSQVEKGTAGDAIGSQRLFKATRVTAKEVKSGAFTDPSSLRGKIAATDIYAGEQLRASNFTAGSGVVDKLAADQRAVSVPLDAAHGLIGDVHPGDHVDVYAGFLVEGGFTRPRPFVRQLFSNVLVLKTHSPASAGVGSQNAANQISDVVLRVNNRQVTQLAFSSDNGKVWLALRPGNASELSSRTLDSLESIVFGSKPIPLKGSGR
jgi:Flp pilus assembly protein CpaB